MKVNKRKKVDFAQAYKKYDQKQKSLSGITVFLTFFVAILIILGVYYTRDLYEERDNLADQLAVVEAYIYDSDNLAKVQEVTEKAAQIQTLTTASSDLDAVAYITSIFPKYDSDFIDALNYEGITIDSINYSVARVSINAEASDYQTPGEYVAYLKSTDLFYEVNYSGFTQLENENGDSTYQFTTEGIVLRGDSDE